MVERIPPLTNTPQSTETTAAGRVNQYLGTVRQLLPTLATLLTAFGVISATQEATLVAIGAAVVGFIGQLIGFWWQWKSDSPSSIIQAAVQLPSVTAITTTDPGLAQAAKAADPNTTVKVTG